MFLKKGQLPIVLVVIAVMFFYTVYFVVNQNYEFLIYVGLILFLMSMVLATNKWVHYSNSILWGLAIWAILHMLGGGIYLGETRLFEWILIPLSDRYPIFRYDQLLHLCGYGIVTLLLYHLINPLLKPNFNHRNLLCIFLVLAGLGAGALYEIIEFFITVIVPNTGVGDYVNNALDLVFNFIGAILAVIYIRLKLMPR